MKKIFFLTMALVGAATAAQAGLHLSVGIGLPIAVPAPVYVAPPPVYVTPAPIYVAPAPVCVAPPPVVCAPPPVVYAPAPSFYFGFGSRGYLPHRGYGGYGYGRLHRR